MREAVKGVRELFSWKIKLVPIKEMTDVLSVTRKPISLEKNSWVRVKRGVYRGDIAQVSFSFSSFPSHLFFFMVYPSSFNSLEVF